MATSFPSSLDSLTNPGAGDSLASPSHSAQHANANDAIEALQAKVGVNGSAVTSSLDYKVEKTMGLVLVKTQTVGTAVSSVTVSSAFSSTFANYRIVITGVDCSAAGGVAMRFRFGTTATGYYGSQYYDLANGTGTGFNRENNGASAICGFQDTENFQSSFDVYSPNQALRSYISGFNYGALYSGWFVFAVANTTQYTAFDIFTGTGTMTGGTIRVYGYNNG